MRNVFLRFASCFSVFFVWCLSHAFLSLWLFVSLAYAFDALLMKPFMFFNISISDVDGRQPGMQKSTLI